MRLYTGVVYMQQVTGRGFFRGVFPTLRAAMDKWWVDTLRMDAGVYTTAEIVVAELRAVAFARRFDAQTGYRELNIIRRWR